MSNQALHDTIRELKEYKLLKEEAESKIAELETTIKNEMKSQELEKMVIGEYKCSLTTVSSKRIDSKALQENRPDIYALFVRASTYERLTVR